MLGDIRIARHFSAHIIQALKFGPFVLRYFSNYLCFKNIYVLTLTDLTVSPGHRSTRY